MINWCWKKARIKKTRQMEIKYIMMNKIQHLCKTFQAVRLLYILETHNPRLLKIVKIYTNAVIKTNN